MSAAECRAAASKLDGFPPESVITGYTPALTIARLINRGAS